MSSWTVRCIWFGGFLAACLVRIGGSLGGTLGSLLASAVTAFALEFLLLQKVVKS